MATQRVLNGRRVLHTRKLSTDRIEVTYPPATSGGPRVREVIPFDTYQKNVRHEPAEGGVASAAR